MSTVKGHTRTRKGKGNSSVKRHSRKKSGSMKAPSLRDAPPMTEMQRKMSVANKATTKGAKSSVARKSSNGASKTYDTGQKTKMGRTSGIKYSGGSIK